MYGHTGPVRATELVQWPRWPNRNLQRIHSQPHGRQAGHGPGVDRGQRKQLEGGARWSGTAKGVTKTTRKSLKPNSIQECCTKELQIETMVECSAGRVESSRGITSGQKSRIVMRREPGHVLISRFFLQPRRRRRQQGPLDHGIEAQPHCLACQPCLT